MHDRDVMQQSCCNGIGKCNFMKVGETCCWESKTQAMLGIVKISKHCGSVHRGKGEGDKTANQQKQTGDTEAADVLH
jgi:hypothetical protein